MKPKAYLVKTGRLPAGSENARGRLSADNIAFLKAAAANGEEIDGYSLNTNAVTKEVTVTKVAASPESSIAELSPYRYELESYRGYELRDGKKFTRSLKEVCSNSGYSVVVCPCDSHRIVATDGTGSVNLYIERV